MAEPKRVELTDEQILEFKESFAMFGKKETLK